MLNYLTHDDICSSFEGDTLLAVQAPNGTQLEVPIPELLANQKRRYQIHLKSTDGQIYVLFVNKDSEHETPVVVQVPPPKDLAEALEKLDSEEEESVTERKPGQKSKARSPPIVEKTVAQPATKRQKTSQNDQDTEVASILSGKVLNTEIPDFPGLEDFMSSESKIFSQIFFKKIFMPNARLLQSVFATFSFRRHENQI